MAKYSISYLILSFIIFIPLIILVTNAQNRFNAGVFDWDSVYGLDVTYIGIFVTALHLLMAVI